MLVLVACGATEITSRLRRDTTGPTPIAPMPVLAIGTLTLGMLASLIWVAFKVDALSYQTRVTRWMVRRKRSSLREALKSVAPPIWFR